MLCNRCRVRAGGRSLPGSHLQALKNLPHNCWDAAQGRGASLPPGAASPGPWTAEKKKKREGKANFCASVLVKVSFLPSFLFLGGCYISTSLPCSSALAKTCPGELVGCCFCCSAWLLLGMLKESSPFLISSLPPGEGGREGVPWPNPLQQHWQSWVRI